MVPRCAVQVCFEAVREALARGDGALPDSWHTIFPRSTGLEKAVPMKCGSFVGAGDVVVDCDNDPVSPISFDRRAGKLAVDEE